MNKWIAPVGKPKIGNYLAAKNKVTKELCLKGKYGEIWIYDEYYLMLTSSNPRPLNPHLQSGDKFESPNELLLKIKNTELPFWIQIIKVYPSPRTQARKLNNKGSSATQNLFTKIPEPLGRPQTIQETIKISYA